MNHKNRRSFLRQSLLGIPALGAVPSLTRLPRLSSVSQSSPNRIGVSTYSFWRFEGPKENTPIESCIEQAAAMGFDGVELLLIQMESDENQYLQQIKRRAF